MNAAGHRVHICRTASEHLGSRKIGKKFAPMVKFVFLRVDTKVESDDHYLITSRSGRAA